MKFQSVVRLNAKKYLVFRGKALFLVIPITILVALSVMITSQSRNISQAAETSIYGTAQQQAKLIELSRSRIFGESGGANGAAFSIRQSGQDENFSQSDVETILGIEHVSAASIATEIPLGRMVAKGLFTDAAFSITQLKSLDSELASLYTEEEFDYLSGEPIPIILNSAAFVKRSEEWNGKTEISLSFGRRGQGGPGALQSDFPIKNEAIAYDADALVGTEFQIEIGGLEDLATFDSEFTSEGSVLKKLSDESIAEREAARKSAISTYWDYDTIATPLTYTFKVVGVIESEMFGPSYVPSAFGDQAMRDIIQHQLDARTGMEIPTDELNSTWLGMTYDGLELQSAGGSFGGFAMRIGGGPGEVNGGSASVSTNYSIPGLVIETERATGEVNAFLRGSSGDVKGIVTNADVFTEAAPRGDTVIIQIDDVDQRQQVVASLNEAGFTYQDIDKSKVYGEIQSAVRTVATVTLVAFIVLSIIFITLMLTKSVSESRKEIGVFRAIGARRSDIQKLFITQGLILTSVGYVVGTLAGLGLTLSIANATESWFSSFIEKTVGETFQVVQEPAAGVFRQIDWSVFLQYSIILLGVALLASIVPAMRAAKVSPIQAIRNE